MDAKTFLRLTFSQHARLNLNLNLLEDVLPEVSRRLVPLLSIEDQNTYPSLEEGEVEQKLIMALISAFEGEISADELNRYLNHKHCKPGGVLFQMTYHHSLFSQMEKNGVCYVN